MSNPFIPYNLRVKDITSASALIQWETDNVVEFRAGTYYKVYDSDDDLTYTFLEDSNLKYISLPLRTSSFYVKITSVVVGMGESNQSTSLQITQTIGVTDGQDATTVAVTQTGDPIKLRVGANGELVVSSSAVPSGAPIATEAKQNTQIAQLTAITTATHIDLVDVKTSVDGVGTTLTSFKLANHTDLVNLLNELSSHKVTSHNDALSIQNKLDTIASQAHADLGVVSTKIDDLATAIDNMSAIENLVKLLRSSTTISDVTPAGVSTIIPWKKKSIVHQITVLKKFGSAAQWQIELINKTGVYAEENVIFREYSYNSYDPNRYDILKHVPYVNIDNNDEIILRLTVDTGTSNIFYVAISGEEAR